MAQYFARPALVKHAEHALALTHSLGRYDIYATANGGGLTGQAGAVRLGVARALVRLDESLRGVLGKEGLLTRDARMKERKKYGQAGARKRFQFSKR
jgi:small subunit ribosomal protein S9